MRPGTRAMRLPGLFVCVMRPHAARSREAGLAMRFGGAKPVS
ncbi:hypothetical protein [Streptomyces himalayensis]|nr:hypothetical protein [Streptomyces himalayensis]